MEKSNHKCLKIHHVYIGPCPLIINNNDIENLYETCGGAIHVLANEFRNAMKLLPKDSSLLAIVIEYLKNNNNESPKVYWESTKLLYDALKLEHANSKNFCNHFNNYFHVSRDTDVYKNWYKTLTSIINNRSMFYNVICNRNWVMPYGTLASSFDNPITLNVTDKKHLFRTQRYNTIGLMLLIFGLIRANKQPYDDVDKNIMTRVTAEISKIESLLTTKVENNTLDKTFSTITKFRNIMIKDYLYLVLLESYENSLALDLNVYPLSSAHNSLFDDYSPNVEINKLLLIPGCLFDSLPNHRLVVMNRNKDEEVQIDPALLRTIKKEISPILITNEFKKEDLSPIHSKEILNYNYVRAMELWFFYNNNTCDLWGTAREIYYCLLENTTMTQPKFPLNTNKYQILKELKCDDDQILIGSIPTYSMVYALYIHRRTYLSITTSDDKSTDWQLGSHNMENFEIPNNNRQTTYIEKNLGIAKFYQNTWRKK